jgi:hypothetical protein
MVKLFLMGEATDATCIHKEAAFCVQLAPQGKFFIKESFSQGELIIKKEFIQY